MHMLHRSPHAIGATHTIVQALEGALVAVVAVVSAISAGTLLYVWFFT
jgi:hypothetical protein